MNRKATASLSAAVLAGASFFAANAGAATVDVTPTSANGWSLYSTDSGGIINSGTATAEFVEGPGTPPLGTGSAHLQTGSGAGNGSAQLRYRVGTGGVNISDITELGYSTYVTTNNGSQAPYITLWIDTNGDNTREGRLWFEPTYSRAAAGNGNPSPQPDVTLGSWQSWNALGGMWYTDGFGAGIGATAGSGAKTWSYILTNLPVSARIINDFGQTDGGQAIGGVRVTAGLASAGNNFNTNVDAFSFGVGGNTTTYNFEAVPEPASIGLLAIAGATLLGRRSRRR